MLGLIIPFKRSCEIAEEIASKSPAAVESAAAKPPATTSATTQPGRLAISGFASTRKSLSGPFFASFSFFPKGMCSSSLPFHPNDADC